MIDRAADRKAVLAALPEPSKRCACGTRTYRSASLVADVSAETGIPYRRTLEALRALRKAGQAVLLRDKGWARR